MLFWARGRPAIASSSTAAISRRRAIGDLVAARGCRSWKPQRARWRWRWSSASCSIASASCSRSATSRRRHARPELLRSAGLEARLASFIAIAKGDVPARHWFRLGRAVTPVGDGAALISWSGSMFEYLMPSLVMRAPAGSLLEQTNRLIVRAADRLWRDAAACPGAFRSPPTTPATSNSPTSIRISACPALALKRGLGENLVVAPYATALAAMVDPRAACANLARLADRRRARPLRLLRGARLHAVARAGGRERRDRARLHGPPPGHDDRRHRQRVAGRRHAGAVPRRAHRPGDGTAAAGARAARRRGCSPLGRATCKSAAASRAMPSLSGGRRFAVGASARRRPRICSPTAAIATMLTAAGSGYSRWGDIAVTRWREDPPATTAAPTSSCATSAAARSGRPGFSRAAPTPDEYEVDLQRGPRRVRRAATAR